MKHKMNFATSKTSRAFRHVKYGSHTTLFFIKTKQ